MRMRMIDILLSCTVGILYVKYSLSIIVGILPQREKTSKDMGRRKQTSFSEKKIRKLFDDSINPGSQKRERMLSLGLCGLR